MKFWRRFSYLVLMDPAPTAVLLNEAMDLWTASSCASLSAAYNYKNISRYSNALPIKRRSTYFLRRLRTIKRRHVHFSSQIICPLTLSFLNTLPQGNHKTKFNIMCEVQRIQKLITSSTYASSENYFTRSSIAIH